MYLKFLYCRLWKNPMYPNFLHTCIPIFYMLFADCGKLFLVYFGLNLKVSAGSSVR